MGWALGILAAGFSWTGLPAIAWATDLPIRFDELEAYTQAESPRARILVQELMKLKGQRDTALQWSNPEIVYDREDIESSEEWQITLHKNFVMPLSQSKYRAGWADRVRAAELRFDQEMSNLLADIKTDYVRLRLLDNYLTKLEQLEKIVTKASSVAEAQHEEGKLSGVERHLIQLSALSLDSQRRNTVQELREISARWHADIGIPAGVKAALVTQIAYKPVELASAEEYMALLDNLPGVESQVVLQQALHKQAEAAKPSLIPGIDLYVGYKRIEPELDGFVGGVALSIPIFDRNAGAARELEAEQRIVENQLNIYRTRSAEEITSLVSLIEDARKILSVIAARLEDDIPMIDNLFYSYQEGHYTLDTFLNAIQIEVTGTRDYYDQLHYYYSNIFRLEAITGAEIVSFEPQESDE
jgi:hypothetical protein